MIRFEIDGKEIDPSNIHDIILAKLLENVKKQLHQKIGSMRHPVTGESPVVVVKGKSFDNLSIEVEGSSELVELVQQKLNEDNSMAANTAPTDRIASKEKIVFLCHGSEDKLFVRKLANDLTNRGLKVFFDEWEIGPGDSIREKIDSGLAECTHFVVILTQTSINKPWVNKEIDAAFVQHVEESVVFIPIRLNLSVESLPPLLRAKHSPSFDEYDANFENLVSSIYGISNRPPAGNPPFVIAKKIDGIGISPAAQAIVKLMIERTDTGYSLDPLLTPDAIRTSTSLADDDIADATDELEAGGFVRRHHAFGEGDIGFIYLSPENELFIKFDRYFKEFNAESDAICIAAELVNNDLDGINVEKLASSLGWGPRRMNPAVNYLISRNLAQSGSEMGSNPWTTFWIRKIPATKRFVKDRS